MKLKKNFLASVVINLLMTVFFACSKEETTTTTTTTTIQSETWVKLTVQSSSGTLKSNYTVLMFETRASEGAPLPAIFRKAVSNAQGVAYFDLNKVITSSIEKNYYFIAVQELSNGNLIWESPYMQQEFAISKGHMITSSIIVQ